MVPVPVPDPQQSSVLVLCVGPGESVSVCSINKITSESAPQISWVICPFRLPSQETSLLLYSGALAKTEHEEEIFVVLVRGEKPCKASTPHSASIYIYLFDGVFNSSSFQQC